MGYATLRSAIRRSGLAFRVCRISQPCFRAVDSSERITAKSIAPSMERKPPEIFWRNFIIRPSRSARLLLNGTRGSVRKRSTSVFRMLSRKSRLWPTRRGGRPRRLPVPPARARAGCASWKARPSARIVSYHRSNTAIRPGFSGTPRSRARLLAWQALHPARPVLLFDLDQRLEFAQMMRVAQRVPHAGHRVVRLPVVMHDDAGSVGQQAAALRRDAVEGEPDRRGAVQPLRLAANPEAGFVHVL